ncbi:MAG: hypothetical protein AAF429_06210 [Pseudomonadota bacterium]
MAAGRVEAHAFESGADQYAQFSEGVSVIFTYPSTILPLMALGILLSLWHAEGMVKAWPVFLAGQVIGLFAAAFVGVWILNVMLAVGVLLGALAALLPKHTQTEAFVLAAFTGVVSLSLSLEGHGLFELPIFIYAGILFGTNIAVACAAGLARYAMERYTADWMRIVWRVAGSWIAAMLMLIFAFNLTAG